MKANLLDSVIRKGSARRFTVITSIRYHHLMKRFHNCGQATVEYIFILAFAAILGSGVVSKFSELFGKQMGSVGHVLSGHLIVGVCERECFSNAYNNSYSGSD